MAPDILKRLRQATKERRCAIMRYDGQQQIRVVEPHVIYTDQSGSVLVVCFQTRGHSDPGVSQPCWQTFHLRKIESVFLLDLNFKVRISEGFTPDRPEYRNGLIAIATSASSAIQYRRREKSANILLYQARGWLWGVGSAIDRVLSDRH
ncbi:MAG: hypothetical protein ACYDDO_03350 [Acidiferrobacterales bacterium]